MHSHNHENKNRYELSSGSQTWRCEDDEIWHPVDGIEGEDSIPICKESMIFTIKARLPFTSFFGIP